MPEHGLGPLSILRLGLQAAVQNYASRCTRDDAKRLRNEHLPRAGSTNLRNKGRRSLAPDDSSAGTAIGAWIPHHLSSTGLDTICESKSVVERVLSQHRHQDTQPAVHDTAQRTTVPMPSCPQVLVVRGTGRVMLHTRASPVVCRPAQPPIARTPHGHQAAFAARGRHGRDTEVGA